MDRQERLADYARRLREPDRQYNRLPIHSRQGHQMPSFGTIPEEPIEAAFIDRPVESRLLGTRIRQPAEPFQKQRSYSQFQTEGSSLAQQVADLKMMSEMEIVRKQQLEQLEALRTEIREMKQYGGIPAQVLDRMSSIDSSSYQSSNTRSEERPTTREVLLNGQKKNLEVELSAKLREIERMLMKERELQNTIHNLRMELDCKVDEDQYQQSKRQIHKLEVLIDKLKGDLKQVTAQKQRLAIQNGSMKKQLLRKEFESKLFLEDNTKVNDKQVTELTRRCEDLSELVNQLKNDLVRRAEEAESMLLEEKDKYDKFMKESVEELQRKHLAFYQQFKDDLTRLDQLKSKIVKEVKDNRSGFDSFDTEVEYETIFGGLIARLQRIYTSKGDIPINGTAPTSFKQDTLRRPDITIAVEQLRQKNRELEEEVRKMGLFIEQENEAKLRFFGQIEESKQTHQSVLRERDALKREINDLRIVIKEYQKILETNTFLEGELVRLQSQNAQLSKEATAKSETQVRMTINNQQLSQLQRQYQELSMGKQSLEQQYQRISRELHEARAAVRLLQQQNMELRKRLQESSEYIGQVESALRQVKPKLPGIFKKKEQHDDSTYEIQNKELAAKIAQLEQLLYELGQARTKANKSIEEYHNKNQRLTAEVEHLQSERRQLAQENSQLHRSKEQLSNQYQRQVSQMFLSQVDSDRKVQTAQVQLEDQLKRYRADIARLESEKWEYLTLVKDLTREGGRKDQQLKSKQAAMYSKEIALEKEVSRLLSEVTTLKKNYDAQLERVSNAGSETSKSLCDRYEKEINQLQLTVHQQQEQLKQTHALQLQLAQLQLTARDMSQTKQRSMAVDHLWEIKKVEYGNIMSQLGQLRTMAKQ